MVVAAVPVQTAVWDIDSTTLQRQGATLLVGARVYASRDPPGAAA